MCKISIESIQRINQQVMDGAKNAKARPCEPFFVEDAEAMFPVFGYNGFYLPKERIREIASQAWDKMMKERASQAHEAVKAKSQEHAATTA